MPASKKTNGLLMILSASFLCFLSWRYSIIGVRATLMLAGRVLLFLGVSTWMVSSLYPRIRSAFFPRNLHSSGYPEEEEAEAKQRQLLVRKELQEKHSKKTLSYQESVLKPRQEASLRKKLENYYRMTGESWKLTEGHQTGEGEPSSQDNGQEEVRQSPNQEALRRRKLPESATRVHPKPEPPPEKRVIVLPEEPADDTEGVVRVALRCPSGRTIHRRFLKSHSSSLLLDWMLKAGYPPTIYILCTSYPRRQLVTAKDMSMKEAGILTHTVLNVEEKDPSPT